MFPHTKSPYKTTVKVIGCLSQIDLQHVLMGSSASGGARAATGVLLCLLLGTTVSPTTQMCSNNTIFNHARVLLAVT